MFQFRAFPSYGYFIHRTILEYCSSVLPHSEISGSTLICSSPKLIAACHVLHRLLMPRHSPCALISLTFAKRNCTPLRPSLDEHPFRFVPFVSPNQTFVWFGIIDVLYNWFSWIMQAQQKLFSKLFLPYLKSSTIKFFKCYLSITPSVALLSYLFLCSVFKVQLRAFIPSKLNNARIIKGLT